MILLIVSIATWYSRTIQIFLLFKMHINEGGTTVKLNMKMSIVRN